MSGPTFTTKIHGLAELEANLLKLSDEVNKKIVRQAVSDAGEVFRRDILSRVRAMFKKKTGRLFSGIIKRIRIKARGVRGVSINVKVGLRAGRYVSKEKSAWYGRLLETGWIARGRAASGKHIGKLGRGGRRLRRRLRRGGFLESEIRGAVAGEFGGNPVAPRGFMMPSFLAKKAEALEVLKQKIAAGIAAVKFNFSYRGRSTDRS